MRTRALLALTLFGGGLVLAGCSEPGPPEVTFFADGESMSTKPFTYCDVLLRECEQYEDAAARLTVRRGKPVQISLPAEVAETPWVVNVQYLNERGEPQPVRQEFIRPDAQHAYTATAAPGDQLLVVEIQQIGAARPVDENNNPILDEAGNPQYVVRGIWTLQITPA